MKKLVFLLVLAVCFSFVHADGVNFDKLKAAHIAAMQYHGHGTLLKERDQKMVIMRVKGQFVSVCCGKDLATGYAEKGDRKIYWDIQKIEGGYIITIKVNIGGIVFEKSIKILISKSEMHITELQRSGDRLNCDFGCLIQKAPQCFSCGSDLWCWAKCAAGAFMDCCKLF